jgi:hypothetical protein
MWLKKPTRHRTQSSGRRIDLAAENAKVAKGEMKKFLNFEFYVFYVVKIC